MAAFGLAGSLVPAAGGTRDRGPAMTGLRAGCVSASLAADAEAGGLGAGSASVEAGVEPGLPRNQPKRDDGAGLSLAFGAPAVAFALPSGTDAVAIP